MNEPEFKAHIKMLGWTKDPNTAHDWIYDRQNMLCWIQFKLLTDKVTLYGSVTLEGTYSYTEALQVIVSWPN